MTSATGKEVPVPKLLKEHMTELDGLLGRNHCYAFDLAQWRPWFTCGPVICGPRGEYVFPVI